MPTVFVLLLTTTENMYAMKKGKETSFFDWYAPTMTCLAVDCALHPTGASPHLTIANLVTAQLCKFPNRDLCPLLPAFDDTNVLPFDS